MRFAHIAIWLACCAVFATPIRAEDEATSKFSTGRTLTPETKGQKQPQGWTGPIDTGGSGGAPASSPQGQSAPGMQAAPEGSSKTTVAPEKQN